MLCDCRLQLCFQSVSLLFTPNSDLRVPFQMVIFLSPTLYDGFVLCVIYFVLIEREYAQCICSASAPQDCLSEFSCILGLTDRIVMVQFRLDKNCAR